MVADVLAVDEEHGAIVGGADVEEGACPGLGRVVEVALVPEQALVVVERVAAAYSNRQAPSASGTFAKSYSKSPLGVAGASGSSK